MSGRKKKLDPSPAEMIEALASETMPQIEAKPPALEKPKKEVHHKFAKFQKGSD